MKYKKEYAKLVAETEQAGMVLVTFTRMAVLENYDKVCV